MLIWALLASGQISLRRVDGWDTFHVPPAELNLDRAASTHQYREREMRRQPFLPPPRHDQELP